MTHVVAVALADRGLLLRVYSDGSLVIEAPLTKRQGLILLADLANALLLPATGGQNALEFESAPEQDVAHIGSAHDVEHIVPKLGVRK